jgi:YidC/Oxa1 family membrane protein insertase
VAEFNAVWNGALAFLAGILNFIYQGVHDYGVAIILLTVAIRVALLPLTIKQTRSMHELQKIQPKLKAVQDKYKEDKQKMQEEMMKLYQENKVNPLGGCLPTLLQLPVMIALFRMLLDSHTFRGQPSFYFLLPDLTQTLGKAWAHGLATATPYAILLVVVVITTYLPQKMMAQDPQQSRMMVIMSVFMAYISINLPSGVLLYWVTTNIWTVAQQYLMLRPVATEGGA